FKNKGVQPLLDSVVDYLPAPTDVTAINGVKMGSHEPAVRRCSDDEPFAGLAFKIMSDPFVGSLTFARLFDVLAVVRMHLQHTADPLAAALDGIENTTTG